MAGELITADYQHELRGLLVGAGTDYRVRRESPQGLGHPEPKTQDTPLAHQAGVYTGIDRPGPRILTYAMQVHEESAAAADVLVADLLEAWAPSMVDLELHMQRPGFGHISVVGRPRGLSIIERFPGHIDLFGTFFCGNPTITTVV